MVRARRRRHQDRPRRGHEVTKDASLPEVSIDAPPRTASSVCRSRRRARGVHRRWRSIADEYPGRVLIGEIWIPDAESGSPMVRPKSGELHTVFNFPYLSCPWNAFSALRRGHRQHAGPGTGRSAPRRPGCCPTTTWTASCPGTAGPTRPSTLQQRAVLSQLFPVDLQLGTRRARAAALLHAGPCQGRSTCMYQGEEIGLWEVQDIPDELRQDPIWRRTRGADLGAGWPAAYRCPWSGQEPPFWLLPARRGQRGPWLPQPKQWRGADCRGRER